MHYFGQFDRFNPLMGDVPDRPFKTLPEIAERARGFLKHRPIQQLDAAAKAIDFAFYVYFDEIKQDEIARLLREANERGDVEKYFDWDGGSAESGRWLFKEELENDLDIPSPWKTSEVDALRANSDWWVEIGSDCLPEGQPYELAAVLSLWLVADCSIAK